MSTTTEELGLFMYEPETDASQTFNIDQALNANWEKIDDAHKNICENLKNKSPSNHTHDDRYYTEAEIDEKLGQKAPASHASDTSIHVTAEEKAEWSGKAPGVHSHDDRYYTETETDNLLKGKADKSVSFTVSLSAAGWADNAQTVSDARFLAEGFSYIVSPVSGNFYDYGEAGIYAEDVTDDAQMVFRCDSVPDTDLAVNIVRMVSE